MEINTVEDLIKFIKENENTDIEENLNDDQPIHFGSFEIMQMFDHWLFSGEMPNEN